MKLLSTRKAKVVTSGLVAVTLAGTGLAYAFVLNPNANDASATLATTAELPVANTLDNSGLHLQPDQTGTVLVRVTNRTDQSIVVNGIAGGANTAVNPPATPGDTLDPAYCPAGSVTIADAGILNNGSGVAALTPVDPTLASSTWALPSDVGTSSIPSGDTAVFAMQATFDAKDFPPTKGDTASTDPNNQIGFMVGNGGGNQSYDVTLGQLYYTVQ
jgi:hypothetical protein